MSRLSWPPSTNRIFRRAPKMACLTSSETSGCEVKTSASQAAAVLPAQVHERSNNVDESGLSEGNPTSCVEMTNPQSSRFANRDNSNGDTIDRCKWRSGSSMMMSECRFAVSTLAAISIALRSPSDSSAILYGSPAFLLANNCPSVSIEISIGRFAVFRSSFNTVSGASSTRSLRAASKSSSSTASAIFLARTFSESMTSKIVMLARWDPMRSIHRESGRVS